MISAKDVKHYQLMYDPTFTFSSLLAQTVYINNRNIMHMYIPLIRPVIRRNPLCRIIKFAQLSLRCKSGSDLQVDVGTQTEVETGCYDGSDKIRETSAA